MLTINKNVLCWYPFSHNSRILEVLKEESCLLNELHPTLIHVNELNNIKEKYDYIILNNVVDLDNNILNKIKVHLKNNGHILLICPNKFGLKYFSGEKDPITHVPFGAIKNNIKTIYSRNELIQIILKDYKHYKFYYPYPTFENCGEIFTDNSINVKSPSEIYNPIDKESAVLFNEKKVYEEFRKNRIIRDFTNSFLIDICDKNSFDNYDYYKLSINRNDNFKIYTAIDYKNKKVIKAPLSNIAKKHTCSIAKNCNLSTIYPCISYTKKRNGIECDYIKAKSLDQHLDALLEKNQLDEFDKELNKIKNDFYFGKKEIFKSCKQFVEVFGNDSINGLFHCDKNINIDMVFENIFMIKNEKISIDPEWTFKFAIPSEYALWRAMRNYILRSSYCKLSKEQLCSYLEVSESTIDIFEKWENHFLYNYVGSQLLNHKAMNEVDLDNLYQLAKNGLRLKEIEDSTSWKITKPIRKIGDLMKRGKS